MVEPGFDRNPCSHRAQFRQACDPSNPFIMEDHQNENGEVQAIFVDGRDPSGMGMTKNENLLYISYGDAGIIQQLNVASSFPLTPKSRILSGLKPADLDVDEPGKLFF